MKNVIKNQVKKVVLAAVVAGVFVAGANAQTTGATGGQKGPVADGQPAQVALNVILKPTRTLTVNHEQINLVYENANDYANGVSYTTKDGHLRVTNIGGGYKIMVKASSNHLIGEGGNQAKIDGETVTVTGLAQKDVQAYTRKVSEMQNGTNGVELFHHSQNSNVVDKAYDVEYKAAGNNEYINKVYNKQQTKYSVNIVYTIVSE